MELLAPACVSCSGAKIVSTNQSPNHVWRRRHTPVAGVASSNRPKQFLPLFGQYSTFQETIRRVSDPALFGRPIVVTNAQYRFMVAEQLATMAVEADILLEPMRRDSGPAILAGAAFASRRDGDAIIVALAADHVVTDPGAFANACSGAREAAQDDQIVLFGMRPTRPATEYGYIRPGNAIGPGIFAIERFVEKPDAKTAAGYMCGREPFCGNSGNFMFRADFLIEEYRRFEPDSATAVTAAVDTAASDLEFEIPDPEAFARATAKSIDYAVMERTTRAAVMPVSYGWSDVGSWHMVWELSARDADGNAAQGSAVFINARGSYVAAEKQLVALSGLDNVVVVATDDAILVARREDGEGLRQVVKKVNSVAPTLTQDHMKVHRPWGSCYRSSRSGRAVPSQVRIVVKQGGRFSLLQMHHHRAEHWIVVRGTARVTIGKDVRSLAMKTSSIYVPIGERHRLENPGKIDLELIEVQTGSYLGEDDIVRIEDDYHRP